MSDVGVSNASAQRSVTPSHSSAMLNFSIGEEAPWSSRPFLPEPKRVDASNPPPMVRQDDSGALVRDTENHLFGRGPIESMSMPRGWFASKNNSISIGQRRLEIFSPAIDPWIQIKVYDRGEPLSLTSSEAFDQILKSKPAKTFRFEVLLPSEIRKLTEVIGFDRAGNNQFTNRVAAGSKDAPNFHLRSAHTISLNGKTVLVVQGDFIDPQDPTRKAVDSYEGIFIDGGIDSETGARKIQEIYLQGPASRTESFRRHFIDTLHTIEWLNTN